MGRRTKKQPVIFKLGPRIIIVGVTVLLLSSLGLNAYLLSKKPGDVGVDVVNLGNTNNLVIKNVIDGDTVEIENGPFIRLMGVQAPEEGNCYYNESKDYLKSLIEGKVVVVEFESRGAYGRSNAFIYVEDTLVNKLMLSGGYARYEGTKKANQLGLQQAYEDAKSNSIGLWGSCVSKEPINKNCIIKGNITINTNEKSYLFPGCSNYDRTAVDLDKGENWFCSEKEAEAAGFVKSGSCYGKNY